MPYLTKITQFRVKILGPKDYDGYERNRPDSKWELVEYLDFTDKETNKPLRVWTPNYALANDKINDFSKVKIVEI